MATESPSSVYKVVVHLRATGGAPILRQAKFKIPGTDKFAKVIEFLRRQLHCDTLVISISPCYSKFCLTIWISRAIMSLHYKFVYVNSAFSPNPDESVIDLYNNFGFDGKLVVNYANSMAWG